MGNVMRRLGLALALTVTLGSCIGSSVPQPPNLAPVSPGLITGRGEEVDRLPLVGSPGAAPPEVEVWAWNLDTADPPVVVESDAVGAFTMGVPGARLGTTEVRLQVRQGEDRSVPVDLVAGLGGSVAVNRPACLRVPLEVVLERDGARSVEVRLRNECGVEVSLQSAELRVGGAFLVRPPPESRVPVGGELALGLDAPAEGAEDILFVSVDIAGVTVRYPVTLIAR